MQFLKAKWLTLTDFYIINETVIIIGSYILHFNIVIEQPNYV